MADFTFTDPGGAFSNLDIGTSPDFTLVAPPAPDVGAGSTPGGSSFLDSLAQLAHNVTGAAQTYYQTQAQIEQAKAQAAVARAQGRNLVATAQTGQPSSYLLLWGALGIGALLILTRK